MKICQQKQLPNYQRRKFQPLAKNPPLSTNRKRKIQQKTINKYEKQLKSEIKWKEKRGNQ